MGKLPPSQYEFYFLKIKSILSGGNCTVHQAVNKLLKASASLTHDLTVEILSGEYQDPAYHRLPTILSVQHS